MTAFEEASDQRFKCCPCCDTIGKIDHEPIVEGGDFIAKDDHTVPCLLHYDVDGNPRPKSAAKGERGWATGAKR